MSASVEGQTGWGSGQTQLVSGTPAHGRGVGTKCSLSQMIFQPKPFYESRTVFHKVFKKLQRT